MIVDQSSKNAFLEALWVYYADHGRVLPWRERKNGQYDPYEILVSEIMLQQTQVGRVVPYFQTFIHAFPDFHILANADLGDVVRVWSGLGYNRRARYLRDSARVVVDRYKGKLPKTMDELVALPGVGKNTAGAVLVYAFNQPELFIETNIRTVMLHHFYTDAQVKVKDVDILDSLKQVIDVSRPREFYWAMMDYGTYLKSQGIKSHRGSENYKIQPKFSGSSRQLRGIVLRLLAEQHIPEKQLAMKINDDRFEKVISGLIKDGLVAREGNALFLAQ
jgi:A/G-specific adenine glycosylase